MNVASLEQCRELYKLSGWEDTEKVYRQWANGETYEPIGEYELVDEKSLPSSSDIAHSTIPSYDIGYLLHKLPKEIECHDEIYELVLGKEYAGYLYDDYDSDWEYKQTATNPADAICKLAIELFKQNILTKESK